MDAKIIKHTSKGSKQAIGSQKLRENANNNTKYNQKANLNQTKEFMRTSN